LRLSTLDHLAGLTALRDSAQIDIALAQAVCSLYRAERAGVHRVLTDRQGIPRWVRAGDVISGEPPCVDAPWGDLSGLPLLDDHPLRLDACTDQLTLQVAHPPPADRPDGVGWLTVVPLSPDPLHMGVLEVRSRQPLTLEEVRSLQGLLRVVQNHLALLDSSQRDPLTGLLNRQTFDATFLAASLLIKPEDDGGVSPERRQDPGDTWWLGVLDIDHFKQVNDRFGHLIGDEVLVLVARLMRQNFRHYDRLFRFGGEEFVMMVRCPTAWGARTAFERMRRNVGQYPFPQVGRVTVSIGFTQVLGADAPSAAFSRADEAVYAAKHGGRDQVVFHADLVAQGLAETTAHEGGVELF